jgi:acyl-coenzyme A thioesterase PaaI-like protein
MDVTELARSLLGPTPAHRTAGIEVLRAADGSAEVAMDTPYELTNVIGSVHSSGLISLVDAAGLAAIIAACQDTDDFTGVVPLGAAASLEFLALARGRLVASCALDEATPAALRPVASGAEARARISTLADVTDADGVPVCRGRFDWSVRRRPAGSASSGAIGQPVDVP